jgi:hypothetical protein
MSRPPGIVFALATLAAPFTHAATDTQLFAVRGVFSAGGITFVCLQAKDTDHSKWLTEDDRIAGWMVRQITPESPGRIVLEAADETLVELALDLEPPTTPVPPEFDAVWIRSPANPMRGRMVPLPREWSHDWSLMTKDDQSRVRHWYLNHGFDVRISSERPGVYFTNVGPAIRDVDTWINERKRQANAFEQSLSPFHREVFNSLMAVHVQANRPVRFDAPPPVSGEYVESPHPDEWKNFLAMLPNSQAAEFRKLYSSFVFEETDLSVDPDTVVPADTPTGCVQRALALLRQEKNYTWETIHGTCDLVPVSALSKPPPELQSPPRLTDLFMTALRSEPKHRETIGRYIRNHLLHVRMTCHTPGIWYEAIMRPYFPEGAILRTPEGWLTHEECHDVRPGSLPDDVVAIDGVEVRRRDFFQHVPFVTALNTPERDLAEWMERARFFRVEGDSYVAALQRRQFFTVPRDGDGTLGQPQGILVVRLAAGRLAEFHVLRRDRTTYGFDDRLCVRASWQHTRIMHCGTTTIEVPAPARAKLGL